MKKMAVLLVFAACAAIAFAEDPDPFTASALISQGIEKNKEQIKAIAKDLTPDQRMMLWEMHKKEGMFPALLNLGVGFGVGSYMQKDPDAWMGLAYELISIGLLSVGYSFSASAASDLSWGDYEGAATNAAIAQSAYSWGAIFSLASRLGGAGRAFRYADLFNKDLRAVLGPPQVSVNPDASLALTMTIRL